MADVDACPLKRVESCPLKPAEACPLKPAEKCPLKPVETCPIKRPLKDGGVDSSPLKDGGVDISPLKDGGVLKEILKEGYGDELPSSGCKVKVHYTGTLLDGTKFDSSKDRDEPFEFNLGRRQVIKAWDIGVATMKKGEVAMLTCGSEYAYGKNGSPPKIPANATLKFEVEMIDFTGEDLSPNEDGSIQRFQIQAGTSGGYPEDGVTVDVHLIGKYNDKIFEERDVKFCLGEGEEFDIVEGVEKALEKFSCGEISRLKIKSKYGFKNIGKPEFNIPPDADVEYTIELKNFEPEESWTLDNKRRISLAELSKDKATKYFKSSKYKLAIKMGRKAAHYLDETNQFEADLMTERDSLMQSILLNLALFYLKTEKYFMAKEQCQLVLKKDPNNVKALFRMGQADLAMGSPEIAVKSFEAALKVEPKNAAATQQIAVCNGLIKQNIAREKKLYANMFDKFAQADKQKEEEELRQQPDVMRGTLGEWGQEERPGGRDATAFEKENPNILMLNANGSDEFKNM